MTRYNTGNHHDLHPHHHHHNDQYHHHPNLQRQHAGRINDGLVDKANAHGDESDEAKPYLAALLAISTILYAGSLSAIGAMFHYFQGCPANELVLSLTLILSLVRACVRVLVFCVCWCSCWGVGVCGLYVPLCVCVSVCTGFNWFVLYGQVVVTGDALRCCSLG